MDTLEKINNIFKYIRTGLSKTIEFIIKIKDILWVTTILIISIFLMNQFENNSELKKEIDVLSNNTFALTDSLNHYHDKLGNIIAEKHALQLTQSQMEEYIGKLKKKNTEYIAYINANIGLIDTIFVEKIIYKDVVVDTLNKTEIGTIYLEKTDVFNKSKRFISASIPYTVSYPSNLVIDDVSFVLNQDIFVEGSIIKNNKTKETMLFLKSDYPGLTFNAGNGIVATNGKQYEKDNRKRNGIGLAVGPSMGIYYDRNTQSLKPAFGLSLTVGYTFTPKAFQW